MDVQMILFGAAGLLVIYSLLNKNTPTQPAVTAPTGTDIKSQVSGLLAKVGNAINGVKLPTTPSVSQDISIVALVADWERLRTEASNKGLVELTETLDQAFKLLNTHENHEKVS